MFLQVFALLLSLELITESNVTFDVGADDINRCEIRYFEQVETSTSALVESMVLIPVPFDINTPQKIEDWIFSHLHLELQRVQTNALWKAHGILSVDPSGIKQMKTDR